MTASPVFDPAAPAAIGTIAAHNSTDEVKRKADPWVAEGTKDENIFIARIQEMPDENAGLVRGVGGDFWLEAPIHQWRDGVEIEMGGRGHVLGGAPENYATTPVRSGSLLRVKSTYPANPVPGQVTAAVDIRKLGGKVASLVQSTNGGETTVFVDGTAGWSTAGAFWMRGRLVTYNGLLSNAFQNCDGVPAASPSTPLLQSENLIMVLAGDILDNAATAPLSSIRGLPASGSVWIDKTNGSAVSVAYTGLIADTSGALGYGPDAGWLTGCTGAKAMTAGGRVNYTPQRTLAGVGLRRFALDGFGPGSPFTQTSGVLLQAFKPVIEDVEIERFGIDNFVWDGGGFSTSPRGAWDGRIGSLTSRTAGRDTFQMVAAATDNQVLFLKAANYGRHGTVVDAGSGVQLVAPHYYFAPNAAGPAIRAHMRQLKISLGRVSNVARGAALFEGASQEGGGVNAQLHVRDCSTAGQALFPAVSIRPTQPLNGALVGMSDFGNYSDSKQMRRCVEVGDPIDETPDTPAPFTVTIPDPVVPTAAVFTKVAHGLRVGDEIQLSTSGALPNGLTPGTSYFVLHTSITPDTFMASDRQDGPPVKTSGSQSGTHSLARVGLGTCFMEEVSLGPFVYVHSPATDAAFAIEDIYVHPDAKSVRIIHGAPRVEVLPDAATITPRPLTHTEGVVLELSQAVTLAAPKATYPNDGQAYLLKLRTTISRALSPDLAHYAASAGVPFPAATTGGGKWDYLYLAYNLTAAKWFLVRATLGLG